MTQQWNNRIVGHSEEDPKALIAHPMNWKLHTDSQDAALLKSIRRVGYLRSVTVDKATWLIVDGHERVLLAIREEQQKIPVEWVDLTEDEISEALVAIDAIAWMAEIEQDNFQKLVALNDFAGQPELLVFLNEITEDNHFQPDPTAGQGQLDE